MENQWRKLYRDAVVETNFDTLGERVMAVEKAIADRSSLEGEVSAEERRELQDSRNSLVDLNKERT